MGAAGAVGCGCGAAGAVGGFSPHATISAETIVMMMSSERRRFLMSASVCAGQTDRRQTVRERAQRKRRTRGRYSGWRRMARKKIAAATFVWEAIHMKRTNLVLDAALLEETLKVSGERTYSRAVERAMQEFVRRSQARRILDLAGSGEWSGDLSLVREDHPPYGKGKGRRGSR